MKGVEILLVTKFCQTIRITDPAFDFSDQNLVLISFQLEEKS